MDVSLLARATAALRALAFGEALGRATEHYRPSEIDEIYEDVVTEFVEPVRLFDDQEWAPGEIGPITHSLVASASSSPMSISPAGGGASPSTAIVAGVVLGLTRRLDELAPATGAGPAERSIAAALSAALSGFTPREVVGFAAGHARDAGDADLAERIVSAVTIAEKSGGRRPGDTLRSAFPPDGGPEAVLPFTFGVIYGMQSARRAILEAVNQGGHAPETAALAGAICAAFAPVSLPASWGADVERRNGLDLEATVRAYLTARTPEPAP